MKFQELTNEEIVFVSTLLGDMLREYEKHLEEGGLSYIVDSPFGKVHLFKEFSSEELEKIDKSDRVRLFRSVSDKMTPIVDLIVDNDPGLLTSVEQMLQINVNDSEEEDM